MNNYRLTEPGPDPFSRREEKRILSRPPTTRIRIVEQQWQSLDISMPQNDLQTACGPLLLFLLAPSSYGGGDSPRLRLSISVCSCKRVSCQISFAPHPFNGYLTKSYLRLNKTVSNYLCIIPKGVHLHNQVFSLLVPSLPVLTVTAP